MPTLIFLIFVVRRQIAMIRCWTCVCHWCISNKLSRQIVRRIWLFKALWCDIAPILAHWFHGNAIKPCVDFVFWSWPGHTVSRDSLVNIQLNLRWAIFMELHSLTNIIKLPLCDCVFESIVFSSCQIYIVLNDRRCPMVQGFLCTFPNAETFQFQVRNSVPKRHHMGLTLIIHMWHIWTGEIGFQYIRCAFRWVLWFSILFRLIQHDRGWCI
jgi:hypothetical protein